MDIFNIVFNTIRIYNQGVVGLGHDYYSQFTLCRWNKNIHFGNFAMKETGMIINKS